MLQRYHVHFKMEMKFKLTETEYCHHWTLIKESTFDTWIKITFIKYYIKTSRKTLLGSHLIICCWEWDFCFKVASQGTLANYRSGLYRHVSRISSFTGIFYSSHSLLYSTKVMGLPVTISTYMFLFWDSPNRACWTAVLWELLPVTSLISTCT